MYRCLQARILFGFTLIRVIRESLQFIWPASVFNWLFKWINMIKSSVHDIVAETGSIRIIWISTYSTVQSSLDDSQHSERYTLMAFLLQAANWHFLIAYTLVNKLDYILYVGTTDFGLIVENFRILKFCLKVLCWLKIQTFKFTFHKNNLYH